VRNEYALITGASSGIGYELAKVFARNGFHLVLVARNRDTLEEVGKELARDCSVDCRVIPADLSLTSEVEEVYRKVGEDRLGVSVLVNDAGVGSYGPFFQTDFAKEARMIDLNVVGLTHMTRLFVDEMVRKGSGKILNVGSVAGFWPVPNMSVYAATKAYVISFSQALASELKGTGVQVSVLCPPAVATNFLKERHEAVPQHHSGGVTGVLERMRQMDAAAVAASGYRGLMEGDRVIIPGAFYRVMTILMKFAPQELVSDLRARHQGVKSSDKS